MLRFKQFLIEGIDKNIVWQNLDYSQRKNTPFFEKLLRDRLAFPSTVFSSDREKRLLHNLTTSLYPHSDYNEFDKWQKADYFDDLNRILKDYKEKGKPEIYIEEIKDRIDHMREKIENIKTFDSKISQVSEKPMRVYRSIRFDPDLPDEKLDERGIEMKKALKHGGIARNSGFLSTSPNKTFVTAFADRFSSPSPPIIFEIDVPEGTRFLTNPLSIAGRVPKELEKFTDGRSNYIGIGENEIIFGREHGLEIDPNFREINIHKLADPGYKEDMPKSAYSGPRTRVGRVYRARLVPRDSSAIDRSIESREQIIQELQKRLDDFKNPVSGSPPTPNSAAEVESTSSRSLGTGVKTAKTVGGKTLRVAGVAGEVLDPALSVGSRFATTAASSLGLGAEVASGMAIAPLAIGALTSPAGESFWDTMSSSEKEAYEEAIKRANVQNVSDIISRGYTPSGRSARYRQK